MLERKRSPSTLFLRRALSHYGAALAAGAVAATQALVTSSTAFLASESPAPALMINASTWRNVLVAPSLSTWQWQRASQRASGAPCLTQLLTHASWKTTRSFFSL